ncbi:MAG: hypothetical protein PF904_19715 [Kiritimatiellae bacterium]|nr:hypothetical protein [Kiritimatiellia bacterium]
MRDVLRRRHYSIRTERTYCDWVKKYIVQWLKKIQHFRVWWIAFFHPA